MIKLDPPNLSSSTVRALEKYQAEIDIKESYTDQVDEADRIWGARSKNKPFEEVKEKLTEMCAGARRCCYCEDSVADEVEHIFPKNRYPEKTFLWENFLYACGPCNGPKNNKFAIFDGLGNKVELSKQPTNIPPAPGDPLLVNPREEDPLEYLFLDLRDTFHFTEWADDPESVDFKRGAYTIELLRLNKRDYLAQARKEAYKDYRARLREYISLRDAGASEKEKSDLIEGIKTKQHPTVWEEMKRQHKQIGELEALFDAAPEALAW